MHSDVCAAAYVTAPAFFHERQYLGFIRLHSIHRGSDVVARELPGARAPCSPVVECDGRRRSSLYQVQYDHEACGNTRLRCDDM